MNDAQIADLTAADGLIASTQTALDGRVGALESAQTATTARIDRLAQDDGLAIADLSAEVLALGQGADPRLGPLAQVQHLDGELAPGELARRVGGGHGQDMLAVLQQAGVGQARLDVHAEEPRHRLQGRGVHPVGLARRLDHRRVDRAGLPRGGVRCLLRPGAGFALPRRA